MSNSTAGQWGLITNPKNVRFYAPVHEPLDRVARSSHVRLLAFSPSGIKSVEVKLPDESTFQLATRVEDSPLYILPWDPSRFAVGSHTIQAKITDNQGRTREIVQDFATREAEVPTFGIIRRLVLMADLGKLFATLTYGIAFANLFVLTVFGSSAIKTANYLLVKYCGRQGVPLIVIRDLHAALSMPWVFWTLFLSTGYVVVSKCQWIRNIQWCNHEKVNEECSQ